MSADPGIGTLEHKRRAAATGRALVAWRSAMPIAGTPGEAYLRSLGIDGETRCRFAPLTANFKEYSAASMPAILAPYLTKGDDGETTVAAILGAWFHVDGVVPLRRDLERAGDQVTTRRADDFFDFPELSLGRVTGSVCPFETVGEADRTLILSAHLMPAVELRSRIDNARIWITGDQNNFEAAAVPASIRRVYVLGASAASLDAFKKRHAKRDDLNVIDGATS